jgi:hypothetical protein
MNKQMESGLDKKQWLPAILRRDLAQVEAPAELWYRVQGASAAAPRHPRRPLAWTLAVALVIVAAVLAVRAREEPAPLAASAAGVVEPARIEFQSGDPAQIRAWLNRKAGIDVALPGVLEPSIRLLGASVVNRSEPAIQVVYMAGDREATLLVEKTSQSSAIRHADLRAEPNASGKITWVMRGQRYTLQCFEPGGFGREDARIACLLCHTS